MVNLGQAETHRGCASTYLTVSTFAGLAGSVFDYLDDSVAV